MLHTLQKTGAPSDPLLRATTAHPPPSPTQQPHAYLNPQPQAALKEGVSIKRVTVSYFRKDVVEMLKENREHGRGAGPVAQHGNTSSLCNWSTRLISITQTSWGRRFESGQAHHLLPIESSQNYQTRSWSGLGKKSNFSRSSHVTCSDSRRCGWNLGQNCKPELFSGTSKARTI